MSHFQAQGTKLRLEQYRLGYPRLAAFLTLDKDFSVLKRFDYLHMRSLLELQDQLSELETRLNHYDDLERIQLGLSSRRQDPNTDRRDLLHIIQTKLETYDKAVQDYNNILQLPEAQTGQLQSVQNWVLGNKPLVRSESLCFIETLSARDHIALGRDKSDRAGLEVLVDLAAKSFPGIARRFSVSESRTIDPNIYILPRHFLERIVKVFMAVFLPLWLTLPVILLYFTVSPTLKAVTYALFTFWTPFVIICTTNTTKYDLMLALITYAALLGAFLAE